MEARTQLAAQTLLERVIYELLDAHQDTVKLTAQERISPAWEVHCEYLRDLQRVALEAVGTVGRT